MDSRFLLKLMDARGVSGHESHVRSIIEKEIKHDVDHIKVDKLGNLIAKKLGDGPRLMVAAHMDEVGLMVHRIDSNGKIYLTDLGWFNISPLISLEVEIFADKGPVRGVITTETLSVGEEEKKLPVLNDVFVDTGYTREQLQKLGVQIGDYVYFTSTPSFIQNNMVFGKALDNRIGCFILVEVIKRLKKVNHEINFVFTVQEEMGMYGARTSAFEVHPDWGIAVDVTPSSEACLDPNFVCQRGPRINAKDGEFVANRSLKDWLTKVAKKNKIQYSIEAVHEGTTDATSMAISRGGIPVIGVGVPVKNLHTTIGIAHLDDVKHTIDLLEAVLRNPIKRCDV